MLNYLKTRQRSVSRFLLVFVLFALCGCTEEVTLQSGLSDQSANEIITVLRRHGIDSQKKVSKAGVSLLVVETDVARATEALHTAGLPRRTLSDLGQVFKKEGVISTPLEERVRYLHGLSQELEYTLQQIDHVVSARVHVVLPERVAPGEPIQPSSAAVFIKYRPPFDEDMIIPRIRNLVALSIPGLTGDDNIAKVSVVVTPSEELAKGIEWTTVGPFKVLKESANGVWGVLIGLCTVLLLCLASWLISLAMRNPRAEAWVNQRVGKARPFRALTDKA